MQSIKLAYTCTPPVLLTRTSSSGFSGIFMAPSVAASSSPLLYQPSSRPTPMQIGQAVRTQDTRRQATVCSLGTRLSHGQQRDNRQSPGQVRKLSTGQWPTPPLNAAGYETYFRNFMFMSGRLLSSIVTTYLLYIYLRNGSSSRNEAR